MKRCHCCRRNFPLWMFRKVPSGWYSRDGLSQCCRICGFRNPYRVRKLPGSSFLTKMEGYEASLKQRLKELFKR